MTSFVIAGEARQSSHAPPPGWLRFARNDGMGAWRMMRPAVAGMLPNAAQLNPGTPQLNSGDTIPNCRGPDTAFR